jgi:uncharacterized membrane protein YfcA
MLTAILLGAVVGAIAGLTGAGGGIMATPLLIFGLGLNLTEAAPIGLMAAGLSAALGALMGLRVRIVRYRAATLIAVAGMLMAPLGVWVAARVPVAPLTLAFAAILLHVAYRGWRKTTGVAGSKVPVIPPCMLDEKCGRLIWTVPCARVLAGCGLLVGFLSGLLGVGGGFVIVPALQRYTNLDLRSIVPTSLAVIALVSVSGVTSSALSGSLDWSIALPFSAGALGGMLGGRLASARMSANLLQKAFAVLCLGVAIALTIKTLA